MDAFLMLCFFTNFELESQVLQYKNRLDELRKAKNNLIIKKTTEYVNTVLPGQG